MPYTISLATPLDANGIAKILYTPEREWSILQRGPVPLDSIIERRAKKFAETLQDPATKIVVAKNEAIDEIVSFAEWQLVDEAPAPGKDQREEQLSSFITTFDPRMKLDLITDLFWKLGQLQIDALTGQKHWCELSEHFPPQPCHWVSSMSSLTDPVSPVLNNLATLPSHRRMGLGSKLVSWPFEMAAREGLPCFLTTEAAGEGRRVYEKHGFQRTSDMMIDLEKYGGKGPVMYIGMVRLPKPWSADPIEWQK